MPSAAQKLESVRLGLEYGRITEEREGKIFIALDEGSTTGSRAVSCLVDPLPGDLALISRDSFGRAWVLAVLERPGDHVSLTFKGDLTLKVQGGRLAAVSRDGIDFISAGQTTLASTDLTLAAESGKVNIGKLIFGGAFWEGQVEKIKIMGQTCQSIFETVSQRARDSFRWVAGTDNVTAGQAHYLARILMSIRGKYAVVKAEKDVKIDGDQILMG